MKRFFAIFGILIIAAGGFFAYYYATTYHGVTAYAKTSETVPAKEDFTNKEGKKIDGMYTYRYTLNFVKEDGKTQKMSFLISGEDATPLAPNTFIKAKISKKRVIEGPNSISPDQLPEKVAAVLK